MMAFTTAAAHSLRRIIWIPVLVVLVLSSGAGAVFAQPQEDTAAPLERLIRYVRWPNEANVHHPWQLCVVGDTTATAQHFAQTRARNREVQVIAPRDPSETSGCHLLDLRQLDSTHAAVWLNAVRGRPVLTIGNEAAFCTRGGHICFTYEGTPPFEINLSAAQAASLRVSARLLARDPDHVPP